MQNCIVTQNCVFCKGIFEVNNDGTDLEIFRSFFSGKDVSVQQNSESFQLRGLFLTFHNLKLCNSVIFNFTIIHGRGNSVPQLIL